MEKINFNQRATVQYSNSNLNLNNSNSTVEPTTVLRSLTDLIPNDGYNPFYLKQLKLLGYQRFMELAKKARKGSDTPAKLFAWMLKHNDIVN